MLGPLALRFGELGLFPNFLAETSNLFRQPGIASSGRPNVTRLAKVVTPSRNVRFKDSTEEDQAQWKLKSSQSF